MLPVNYDARSTQRELDKLKNKVDRVDALAVGPTGPAGAQGIQGAVGLTGPQGPAGLGAIDVLDEDDMASDSSVKLATQQSIKSYVDTSVNSVSVERFGAVGDGSTDDTTALQAAFTHGLTTGDKILLSGKTYLFSGLLATVNKALAVEGQGSSSILLKADSYTGSTFKVSATFGILGQFYPNSAQDNTTGYEGGLNLASVKSPSFEAFSIIGKTRGSAGHGFEFNERNDMVTITDVNIFNLKGSAIRFSGEQGNIRESTFTRLNVRMCGDTDTPAVDIKMPYYKTTGVVGSTVGAVNGVGGKTRWTLVGSGDNFSSIVAANGKIRVQDSRLDGGTKEWPIESIISDTIVEMPYSILDNDPDNPGFAYGKIPKDQNEIAISVPATFYKDVDGINHMVFTDCQIVGCYGTYLNIEHERVNYFRRIIFNNLMVHGSNKKFKDNVFYGPSGDLINISGGTGSVYFRGLRLNTLEQDPTVTSSVKFYDGDGTTKDFNLPYFNLVAAEIKVYVNSVEQTSGWSINGGVLSFTTAPPSGANVVRVTHATKYAGLRIKAGSTITTDIPDRVYINDLDLLNLENYGEGYIVVDEVKNLTINGTVAASAKSGPELIVKADAVSEAIDYNVISGTSKNVRNVGITPAFFIDDSVADKVFITENQRSQGFITVKDLGAVGNGIEDDTDAFIRAFASGNTIYVPKGTYLLPNWTKVIRTTKLTIKGEGVIKGVGNTDTFIDPRNDIDISGVSFEGFAFVLKNVFDESTAGINNLRFHSVIVKDCGAGISLERPISNLLVTGCDFRNITANKPIRIGKNNIGAQNTWKHLTITDNKFRSISTTGDADCNAILVYGRQAVISNNVFTNIGAVGAFETFSGDGSNKTFTVVEDKLNEGQCTVYLNDVEQVNTDETTLWTLNGTTKQLTFTTAPAVGTNNIKFYYVGESAAIYTKVRFATITGNTILGMGKLPDGTVTLNVNQIYGINVKGRGRGDTEKVNGFNVAVTGNTLVGESGYGSGIRIQNDCVNVTGNNIERFRWGINGNTAIHDDSNISNNNIYHCSQYGINFIQSGTNAIVQGNNITGVDVGSGVYEPLTAIHVKGHYDTENYNISNNSISGCKKGIKLSSTAEAKTDWTVSTAFALGDKVVNNSINYKCTTAGTSASSGGGPTGTGSAIADGSVVWQYVTFGSEISNVLITNNTLSNVTNNGIEFASCNTITLDNNQYVGEVANTFIRPVNPNQNVTIRDSRTKSFNTGTLQTIQTWNTSIVDQVARITASVTGKQGNAEFAAYKITGLFKVSRETVIVEGEPTVVVTLAQVGSTVTEYAITSSGAASWDVPMFTLSADDVYLRVRGTQVTNTPTQWSAKTEYVSTTDALF